MAPRGWAPGLGQPPRQVCSDGETPRWRLRRAGSGPPMRMRQRRPGRTASHQRAPRCHGAPGSAVLGGPPAGGPGPSPSAVSECRFPRGRGRSHRPGQSEMRDCPAPARFRCTDPQGTVQAPFAQFWNAALPPLPLYRDETLNTILMMEYIFYLAVQVY